jgi:hypothetical protein
MSELSAHAEARRESILTLAKREARRRRRARRLVRGAGLVIAFLALAMLCEFMLPGHSPAPPHVVINHPTPPPAQIVRIERIETDPHITARLAITTARPIWKTISDRELLQALADAGKPAGLIEVDGRATLVPR